jgi:23S rRNA (cytidine1920-2'-O)/16S rRNA (cytidine1409-2'-O)-methyltransferase
MDAHISPSSAKYLSRGGNKLAAALDDFQFPVEGLTCADLGSHVGGFVDCLLQRGAKKVYSVDTSYGTLGWKLRKDRRVVVMERTNAMHVALPEPVDLVTIDVGWTTQRKVLPNVRRFTKSSGSVIALVKPHYEAPPEILINGVLPDESCRDVLGTVLAGARECLFDVVAMTVSPIRGHGGNREFFAHFRPVLDGFQDFRINLEDQLQAVTLSANAMIP